MGHVLMVLIAAFLLYHLVGNCGCANRGDGFSVGGIGSKGWGETCSTFHWCKNNAEPNQGGGELDCNGGFCTQRGVYHDNRENYTSPKMDLIKNDCLISVWNGCTINNKKILCKDYFNLGVECQDGSLTL